MESIPVGPPGAQVPLLLTAACIEPVPTKRPDEQMFKIGTTADAPLTNSSWDWPLHPTSSVIPEFSAVNTRMVPVVQLRFTPTCNVIEPAVSTQPATFNPRLAPD